MEVLRNWEWSSLQNVVRASERRKNLTCKCIRKKQFVVDNTGRLTAEKKNTSLFKQHQRTEKKTMPVISGCVACSFFKSPFSISSFFFSHFSMVEQSIWSSRFWYCHYFTQSCKVRFFFSHLCFPFEFMFRRCCLSFSSVGAFKGSNMNLGMGLCLGCAMQFYGSLIGTELFFFPSHDVLCCYLSTCSRIQLTWKVNLWLLLHSVHTRHFGFASLCCFCVFPAFNVSNFCPFFSLAIAWHCGFRYVDPFATLTLPLCSWMSFEFAICLLPSSMAPVLSSTQLLMISRTHWDGICSSGECSLWLWPLSSGSLRVQLLFEPFSLLLWSFSYCSRFPSGLCSVAIPILPTTSKQLLARWVLYAAWPLSILVRTTA